MPRIILPVSAGKKPLEVVLPITWNMWIQMLLIVPLFHLSTGMAGILLRARLPPLMATSPVITGAQISGWQNWIRKGIFNGKFVSGGLVMTFLVLFNWLPTVVISWWAALLPQT